jgi:stalled ribosome rescue protein Dom34
MTTPERAFPPLDARQCAAAPTEHPMTLFHAVVWLDHHSAQVLQFDDEQVQAHKVQAHLHHTPQHGSAVRTEHEFFGSVCDAMAGIAEVLVTGSHTAQSDFRHYVEKHRPALAPHIAGWHTVDHPSEGQLLALARKFFVGHDRMSGTPTPS